MSRATDARNDVGASLGGNQAKADLVVSEQDSTTACIRVYFNGSTKARAGGSKGEANNTPRTTSHGERISRVKGLSGGRISFPHLPPSRVRAVPRRLTHRG